jgi:IstB-like ATP binding protein
MARAFEELATNTRAADLDHAEWLGLLLDRELADRQDRRLRARLRYARLRHKTSIIARRVVSIALCSRSSHKVVGSKNSRT